MGGRRPRAALAPASPSGDLQIDAATTQSFRPQVQRWFPDKRGVASSICAAAFGAGALVWAPPCAKALEAFRTAPTAAAADAAAKTVDGARFVDAGGGEWAAAVLATPTDLAAAGQPTLDAGLRIGAGTNMPSFL